MPTGPLVQQHPVDAIGNAVKLMRIATKEEPDDFRPTKAEKSQAAVERRQKGGAARTIALTPQKRHDSKKSDPVKLLRQHQTSADRIESKFRI